VRFLDVNGPFAATALSGLVLLAWLAAQLLGAVVYVGAAAAVTGEPVEALAAALEANGDALCALAAFAGLVAALTVRLLKRPIGSWSFGLRPALLGVSVTAAFLVAASLVGGALGRPEAPAYVLELYRSSSLPLFALAVVVAAPLWEELVFRGLLFEGWARVHPALAVVVGSLAWSIIHVQYDLYDVSVLLLYGLLLGALRWRTGSIGLPVLLHAAFNTVALVELMLVVG
jgi:membrane protease YdiL (CAAX protease family)